MSRGHIHLALFNELAPATEAIARLRHLGVKETDMEIISGIPYLPTILGRPRQITHIPWFSIVGFLVGFVASILLNWGTPAMYPIRVGGMPYYPFPTTLVLTFEISMLGMLIFTFLGLILESAFPALGPQDYHPEISNGKIAIKFACPPELDAHAYAALKELGAEWVQRSEAKPL